MCLRQSGIRDDCLPERLLRTDKITGGEERIAPLHL
jgi:hypothetical protein